MADQKGRFVKNIKPVRNPSEVDEYGVAHDALSLQLSQ